MGVGGCFRDMNGIWIPGYSKYVSRGTVLQVELWAILLSLNPTIQMNIGPNLKFEIDSKQAVHLFTDLKNAFHPLDLLISGYLDLRPEGTNTCSWGPTCVHTLFQCVWICGRKFQQNRFYSQNRF